MALPLAVSVGGLGPGILNVLDVIGLSVVDT